MQDGHIQSVARTTVLRNYLIPMSTTYLNIVALRGLSQRLTNSAGQHGCVTCEKVFLQFLDLLGILYITCLFLCFSNDAAGTSMYLT